MTTDMVTELVNELGRDRLAAALVTAGILAVLAEDNDLIQLAEANDLEHFTEGCHGPAWDRKVTTAIFEAKELLDRIH